MRRLPRLPVALALTVGLLWWWAVLRLVLAPAQAGPVEGAVAVGGWGLGLLPVHCVPRPVRRARPASGAAEEAATRASTLHRSAEGSGRS
ncbi:MULTISPECIES: hypothetical protein [unclassified Streptomyces]|uniref:hypothetical protein n=1 Tax=unclassified Streptomyces TaxID=2593676 RepID=UPI0036C2BAAA